MTSSEAITIRRATPDDALDLVRLAQRDSAAPLAGEVLVAEVDGRAVAAIELGGGRVVADPFRPTAEVVELLRIRARLLRHAAARTARRRTIASLLRPA